MRLKLPEGITYVVLMCFTALQHNIGRIAPTIHLEWNKILL